MRRGVGGGGGPIGGGGGWCGGGGGGRGVNHRHDYNSTEMEECSPPSTILNSPMLTVVNKVRYVFSLTM